MDNFPREVWQSTRSQAGWTATPRLDHISLARIAGRQHGVVTSNQCNTCGFDDDAISVRLTNQTFHRLHHRVYALGHSAVSVEGRFLAGVLACGDGAALCHESAAHLVRIRELPDVERRPVDVYVPRRHVDVPGVRIHRSRTVGPSDIVLFGAIPVLRPTRTVFDLGDVIDELELGRALREATFRYHVDLGRLDELVAQHRGRRAAGVMRGTLEAWRSGSSGIDSNVERQLHTHLRRGGWERFRANHAFDIEGVSGRVDAYLPRLRLVLEADPRHHEREPIRREDALRDALFRTRGIHVLRLTRRELDDFESCVAPRLLALGVRRRGVAVHPA